MDGSNRLIREKISRCSHGTAFSRLSSWRGRPIKSSVRCQAKHRLDLAGSPHNLIYVQIIYRRTVRNVVSQVTLRFRHNAISMTNDVRDGLCLKFPFDMLQTRTRRYAEILVWTKMAKCQVCQLMRKRCELYSWRVISIDLDPVYCPHHYQIAIIFRNNRQSLEHRSNGRTDENPVVELLFVDVDWFRT